MNFNLEDVADSYNGMADQYIRYVENSLDHLPDDRRFIEEFAGLVLKNKNIQVVDCGCGSGYITHFLHSLSVDCWGIDISAKLIHYARLRYPHVRFDVRSMHNSMIAEKSLGGIFAWYSLIHVDPAFLSLYIGEFARILDDDGLLAIAFFDSTDNVLSDFDHAICQAYRWPINELPQRVQQSGFVEITRMLRDPKEGERLRRGHLIFRKS